ncbi:MAG TPA: DUF1993 domain-containing protein [Burkholderiaceae bacterium]|nr:DUF1993 domain-containing protein [Burkholderiaceae bacterium]
MAISMYSASVPVYSHTLANLERILDKAEAYAAARKFDSAVLLGMRLAPDMLPLAKQVQIACDAAKLSVARLAGIDAPKFEDSEASIADLKARVRKTIEFLATVPAAKVDGSETREVRVPRRDGEMKFDGETYLKHYALPNFFFHVTTTYALLRHNGVELGKADYLGALQ